MIKRCQICGKPSAGRFKKRELCAAHLNPPPTAEYLWRERLRFAAGQSSMCLMEEANPGTPSFTKAERKRIGV